MSHHIISGQDSTGRAEAILSNNNALKIYNDDYPSIQIVHVLNNISVVSGATYTTDAIQFKKRSKILIFGTSTEDDVSIDMEISPDLTSPTNYFSSYENIDINNGTIYNFVNLYTDYFRLKITNNETSTITINLYSTSKE